MALVLCEWNRTDWGWSLWSSTFFTFYVFQNPESRDFLLFLLCFIRF